MLVKLIAEIITEVSVVPEDILNADTIGDYKAELDCNVGNGALDHLAHYLPKADITILSAEPVDEGVEEYGMYLSEWVKEYPKRIAKYENERSTQDLGKTLGLQLPSVH
jgi:hypothetical protein